jgi:asparagine synthase (glutamine-hydrolysing)
MKISRGVGKYLLRTWLGKAMPVADAFDRKRGFTVPVGDWMAPHAIALGPLVARVPGVAMSCVPERVEALFRSLGRSPEKHATSACWLLLFFALWYRIHIEGASPLGDIMSTLEGR